MDFNFDHNLLVEDLEKIKQEQLVNNPNKKIRIKK